MVSQPLPTASEELEAAGVVRRPGVVPDREVRAMRDCLWEAVEALGGLVEQEGALRPPPGSEHAMAAVVQQPAFNGIEAHLVRTLDDVFGTGAWSPTAGLWRGV